MTELKKILKLRTVISTSTGMAIATSCYLAGLQIVTILVGDLAWISILVAGFLCLLSSLCFSELTSMYPTAAGIKLFIQHAFNERVSIIIGMFYVVLGISMVGTESFLLASVLSETTRIVDPYYDKFIWMLFFILLVGLINFRGIFITGLVQDIMTYSMVTFLIAVAVYSIATHEVHIGAALVDPKLTFGNVMQAAAIGIFMFVGFEWVAPLAEETTDYRLIGKGMIWAIGLLTLTYGLFILGMYVGLTSEQLASGTHIPHILFGRNLFGTAGVAFFVVMSVLASVTSFNSGLLNTSRFSYAMGRDNVLPRMFSKLHPRYATPWVAILFLALVAIAVSVATLITGKYLFLILVAAALECFIYVVVALCVLRLRKKQPDKERSFRVPFGKVIPVIIIIVFSGMMIGIFADTSRDYRGNVMFENYWVAVVMAAFFLCTAAYALLVVPYLKRKGGERAQARVKRRPGKS